MRFLVLCQYALRASHPAADPRTVAAALATAGLGPVESSVADGMQFGPGNTAVGEFRAPTAQALRRRIESDLALRFAHLGVEVDIRLCVAPVEEQSRRDVAV